MTHLRALLRQPEAVVGTWLAAGAVDPDVAEADVHEALSRLEPHWDELFPAEQQRIARSLVERGDGTVVAAEVEERRVILLAGLHRSEQRIAERSAAIAAVPAPWPAIDPGKAIPWVEQRAGTVLADSQRAAVSAALASTVRVVTAGPGVGETTIVNTILRILAARTMTARPTPEPRRMWLALATTGLVATWLAPPLWGHPDTPAWAAAPRRRGPVCPPGLAALPLCCDDGADRRK